MCPYVRVLPVRLLTELRGCCIASSGSPAMQNIPQCESTSKPFHTRIHPYARQHRQYGNIPEEKVLDTGCGQHVLHKRGPSRDTVTKKSSKFPEIWDSTPKKNPAEMYKLQMIHLQEQTGYIFSSNNRHKRQLPIISPGI